MFIADVKLGRKYRLLDIPKTGIAAYVECAYSMSIYLTFLLLLFFITTYILIFEAKR